MNDYLEARSRRPRNVEQSNYRIKKKFAIAMRRVVNKDAPGKRILPYIGIPGREFRCFIQLLLKPEMSFHNYGRAWVLDHIVPVFLFDQSLDSDLKICWNFLNVAPMPLALNRFKGVSTEFALKELEVRAGWFPGNKIISELQERVMWFVNKMGTYHSDVDPELMKKLFL